MKLVIGSDLHLEFGNTRIEDCLDRVTGDILILAGDIFVAKQWSRKVQEDDKYLSFFKHASDKFDHVIYIMGNHEYYGGGQIHIEHELIKDRFYEFGLKNIHLLYDEFIEIDGQKFFGGTLWSGLKNNDWHLKQRLAHSLNDFRHIKYMGTDLSIDHLPILYEKCLSALEKEIDGDTIVVTHNAPSFKCVHSKYFGSELNWLFANTLDNFISKHQPKLWIHGHMHDPVDIMLGETRVICNPRDYEGYGVKWMNFSFKVIDLD